MTQVSSDTHTKMGGLPQAGKTKFHEEIIGHWIWGHILTELQNAFTLYIVLIRC